MTSRRISDATMAVRDAIYEGLLVRKGSELTESVARERANNICIAVIESLRDLAMREAATDDPPRSRYYLDEPPPIRFSFSRLRELTEDCQWCRATAGNPCVAPDGTPLSPGGMTHLTTEPPPAREAREETAEEHARRVIK